MVPVIINKGIKVTYVNTPEDILHLCETLNQAKKVFECLTRNRVIYTDKGKIIPLKEYEYDSGPVNELKRNGSKRIVPEALGNGGIQLFRKVVCGDGRSGWIEFDGDDVACIVITHQPGKSGSTRQVFSRVSDWSSYVWHLSQLNDTFQWLDEWIVDYFEFEV